MWHIQIDSSLCVNFKSYALTFSGQNKLNIVEASVTDK